MENNSDYKIIIKGNFGCNNFGDDALMLASHEIANMIYKPKEIAFICNETSGLSELIPGVNVIPKRSRKEIVAGVFLFGGGTQFYSFPLTSSNSMRVRAIFKAAIKRPDKIVRKMYRLLFSMPVKQEPDKYSHLAALGVGVGPFVNGSAGEKNAERILGKMDHVAVRDIASYQLCQKWGVKNLSHCTDLCFLPEFRKKHVFSMRDKVNKAVKRIAVIPRDWPHDHKGAAYYDSLFEVVSFLSKAGYSIDFVLFAGPRDNAWIKRLEKRGENYCLWNPETDSFRAFTEKLSGYDLFVTARYHGAVFASLLGRPSVCIGVEQKLKMISTLLGEGARLWEYPFNVEEGVNAVQEINRNYSRSTDALDIAVKHQTACAQEMADDFVSFCAQCHCKEK